VPSGSFLSGPLRCSSILQLYHAKAQQNQKRLEFREKDRASHLKDCRNMNYVGFLLLLRRQLDLDDTVWYSSFASEPCRFKLLGKNTRFQSGQRSAEMKRCKFRTRWDPLLTCLTFSMLSVCWGSMYGHMLEGFILTSFRQTVST
jgi:hypothetical protein